jgi:hypothetical protein
VFSARLCSVFLAIAYPLWFHCRVDKASSLGLFSGIAINILFSIAPLFLGTFWPDLGTFWPDLARFGQIWPDLARFGWFRPPPKEVPKLDPLPQLLWQPFWPDLGTFWPDLGVMPYLWRNRHGLWFDQSFGQKMTVSFTSSGSMVKYLIHAFSPVGKHLPFHHTVPVIPERIQKK